jgi:hypothetical protein
LRGAHEVKNLDSWTSLFSSDELRCHYRPVDMPTKMGMWITALHENTRQRRWEGLVGTGIQTTSESSIAPLRARKVDSEATSCVGPDQRFSYTHTIYFTTSSHRLASEPQIPPNPGAKLRQLIRHTLHILIPASAQANHHILLPIHRLRKLHSAEDRMRSFQRGDNTFQL